MTRRRSEEYAADAATTARSPRARWPLAAMTALVAVALIVLGVLVWIFLTSRSGQIGVDPSPGSSSTAAAEASPSASASEAAETASASASPAPSAVGSEPPPEPPDVAIPPATWDPVALFGGEDELGTTTALYDLVGWDDGLVAIGRQFDGALIEGEIPSRTVAWLSADGETWEERDAEFADPDVRIGGIVTLPGGGLLATGVLGFHQMPPPGEEPQRPAAWTSQDGVAWDEVELPEIDAFGGNAVLLAGSPEQTYVLAVGREVWHSDDGLSWIPVYEAAADDVVHSMASGEGGFVGAAAGPDGDTTTMIASADAHDWVEAEFPGRVLGVAAIGPDWVATAATGENGAIEIWRSANGLDWQRVIGVNELTGPDGPKSGLGLESGITGARLLSAGDVVYLALTWNHCCVLFDRGVGTYESVDGQTWTDAGLGEAAIVAAAEGPEGTVLGGVLNRGDRIGFWLEGR